MLTRIALTVMLLVPLSLTGCCCMDRVYQPDGCCGGADPVLGACDSCGSCGQHGAGRAPCQRLKQNLTCGSGCGQIYWGEWHSDPPDDCDPCDRCGNWVGQRCCSPFWDHFCSGAPGLWGWRCGDDSGCDHGAGCDGGCDGGGYDRGGQGMEVLDRVEGEPIIRRSSPKPAAKPKEAEPKSAAPEEVEGVKPGQQMPDTPPKPMAETQSTRYRTSGRQGSSTHSTQPTRSSHNHYPAKSYPPSRERQL